MNESEPEKLVVFDDVVFCTSGVGLHACLAEPFVFASLTETKGFSIFCPCGDSRKAEAVECVGVGKDPRNCTDGLKALSDDTVPLLFAEWQCFPISSASFSVFVMTSLLSSSSTSGVMSFQLKNNTVVNIKIQAYTIRKLFYFLLFFSAQIINN